MDCDANIARVALFLRYDFKLIIGQIFKENDIFFDEEMFFQNTSIDFEQLVQEAFCYGADIPPPKVNDTESNPRHRLLACAFF